MATIDIKYSQDVIDTLRLSPLNSALFGGSIGSMLDSLLSAAYALNNAYPYFDNYVQAGSTLRLNYGDGAYQAYAGLQFTTPGAAVTSATAEQLTFHKEGVVSMVEAGVLNYNYEVSTTTMSIDPASEGSQLTSLSMAMLLPPDAPGYRPLTGNPAITIDGDMFINGSNELTGTIGKVSTSADKFVLSGVIEGEFKVSTNTLTSGQGKTQAQVSGTLDGFKEDYQDGSHAWLSGLNTQIAPQESVNVGLLFNAAHLAGDDTIKLDMPAKLYQAFNVASGAGNDRISLAGGGGLLNVHAGSGDDVISIVNAGHVVNGGSGLDQVILPGARASYTIKRSADGYTVAEKGGAVNTLQDVERIALFDTHIALDIDGHGGQAYRLYQAAFNRKPDLGGVGFHMWSMDDLGWSLTRVAKGFIDSPEFSRTYGSLSNHDFVVQLYANVLHRAPDEAGLKFHVDLLESGKVTREMSLVGFSESPENKAALIGIIGNGFEYVPFG